MVLEREAMKKLIAITFSAGLGLAGVGLAGVSTANAVPVAPLAQAQAGLITHVDGGCGAGWHRGPHGACRPLFSCPPGWHSGPYGHHCFRN
jgi:hypothetical protein